MTVGRLDVDRAGREGAFDRTCGRASQSVGRGTDDEGSARRLAQEAGRGELSGCSPFEVLILIAGATSPASASADEPPPPTRILPDVEWREADDAARTGEADRSMGALVVRRVRTVAFSRRSVEDEDEEDVEGAKRMHPLVVPRSRTSAERD